MDKDGVFDVDFGPPTRPSDPEGLFHDLKGRSPEIRHLWSHQADILRLYHEAYEHARDVAIGLPTGTGKTLIGLLIAEYRRLQLDERAVYLCPTRQLAKQVGAQAESYGIRAHVLIGKQAEYPEDEFAEYAQSGAVAVTTYSSLFNVNPRFSDPHTIVLDDSHAGESYISDMWSVEIRRDDHPELIIGIGDIFADILPTAFLARLRSEEVPPYERRIVDLVPSKYVRERMAALQELLDTHLLEGESASYSWKTLEGHLVAANLFVSWGSALLRPISPPSLTHLPFSEAHQRIYMSATLGSGGELERITGIPQIARMPVPSGWDKRGSGRRLFLFPHLSLDVDEARLLMIEASRVTHRALVLSPDRTSATAARALFEEHGIGILGPRDIEDSLQPFKEASDLALILANRYDGLDLPDELCRLVIVDGLPCGASIQESFLLTRLAATSLIRDRILTRLVQASGRCTRSDRDYAVVLMLGTRLQEFALKVDNRALLHPELQAELEFGIRNSRGKSQAELIGLVEAFLAQQEAWDLAEEAINSLREQKAQGTDPIAETLNATVGHEIEYLYAMWRQDFQAAFQMARAVSDALAGDGLRGYRGWWYYLAADAALLVHESTGAHEFLQAARDLFGRASKCSQSISWFAELSRMRIDGSRVAETDRLLPLAVEATTRRLIELGTVGDRFEREMASFRNDLSHDEHAAFQRGLRTLGELLGFEAIVPGGTADPDCVWSLAGLLHISHEVKIEQSPKGAIGAKDLRQASGHLDWIAARLHPDADAQVTSCLITPRTGTSADASPHAGDVMRVAPGTLRELAERAVAMLRKVRAVASGLGDEAVQELIGESMAESQLTPQHIVDRLCEQPAKDLTSQ